MMPQPGQERHPFVAGFAAKDTVDGRNWLLKKMEAKNFFFASVI